MPSPRQPWVIGESATTAPQIKEKNTRALNTKVGQLAAKRFCTIATIFTDAFLTADKNFHDASKAFELFYESLKAGNRIEIPSLVLSYCEETWDDRLVCKRCGTGFDYPARFVIQQANGSAPNYFCSLECHQKVSPDVLSPKLAAMLGPLTTEQGSTNHLPTVANDPTGPPAHVVKVRLGLNSNPINTGDDDMARSARTTPGAPLKTGDKPLDLALKQARQQLDITRAAGVKALEEETSIRRKEVLAALNEAQDKLRVLKEELEIELRKQFADEFARLEACHAALVDERQGVANTRKSIDDTLKRLEDRERELGASLALAQEAEAERAQKHADALAKLEEGLRSIASMPTFTQDAAAQIAQPHAPEKKKRGRPPKRAQPVEEVTETAATTKKSSSDEDLGAGWSIERIREMGVKSAKNYLRASGLPPRVRELLNMKVDGNEI